MNDDPISFDVRICPPAPQRKVEICIFDGDRKLCTVEAYMETARTLAHQLTGVLNSVEGRSRRPPSRGVDRSSDGSLVGTYLPPGVKRRNYVPLQDRHDRKRWALMPTKR